MARIPTHGLPTHPGEMLLEEFLKPLRMTQRELADRNIERLPSLPGRMNGLDSIQ